MTKFLSAVLTGLFVLAIIAAVCAICALPYIFVMWAFKLLFL